VTLPERRRGPHTHRMDRDQLADFLRTRREALRPEDVGLVPGPRRRIEGLRREEVATLATMSVDYYTRLEQRRGPQPSHTMLSAIARATRLSLAERDHLFRLAGHVPPASGRFGDHVSPGLMRVLDRLQDTPAQIMTAMDEVVRQTPPAVALFGDLTSFSGHARCTVYRWFTEPASRQVYPADDHDLRGRVFVSQLRAAYAEDAASSGADALVEDLLERSPEFAQVWAAHEVGLPHGPEKRLFHPEVGVMTLQCQLLHDAEQGQGLLVFTAAPGTEDAEKLALVSMLGPRPVVT
jgi:transcriptional regulator with XRE-family HTH domain